MGSLRRNGKETSRGKIIKTSLQNRVENEGRLRKMRELIIELLGKANKRELKLIYTYIKALLDE